jgi:hypothetical protein
VVNYYKNLGLVGSDHKAQLVSIEVAPIAREAQQPGAEGWNWTMMRKDIVEIEAEQRLSSIAAAENTPMAIDAAFDNLMRELTTIADLSTPKRKSGTGKGCPWWNPRVEAAIAAAKQEHRSYIALTTDYRWNRYKEAKAYANKTTEAAKSSSWRRAIAATAYDQKNLWKLEKWARLRSWVPAEDAIIPPLRRSEDDTETHITYDGKATLFAERFFSNPTADFNALETITQLSSSQFALPTRVTSSDVEDILRGTKLWKAPGEDNILAGLLKACGKPLYQMLAALITSSFNAAYFPRRFRTAKMSVLPKPNKTVAQKATPGAWRPISLLSAVGKVIKAAFARLITDAAEAKQLLPDGQMGNKRDKSTDLAIRMMVEIATEARQNGGIASLLQLDIKGAFDTVHHQWLIQILRIAGYPIWCCNWVSSYLADRLAFFFFDNYKSLRFDIPADVPQKSPLLPILFLLYIATFYKNLQVAHPRLFIVEFADNINLIAVNRTFEKNRD